MEIVPNSFEFIKQLSCSNCRGKLAFKVALNLNRHVGACIATRSVPVGASFIPLSPLIEETIIWERLEFFVLMRLLDFQSLLEKLKPNSLIERA